MQINYPAACNAAETLLVHQDALDRVFPPVAQALLGHGVSLRCDERSLAKAPSDARVTAAADSDFDTEFLDLVLAVRVVDSLEEAIQHINEHGSKHTDSI